MDLHEQSYYIAIAEAGSLTKAAEKVHVSQQALSLYVSRLEKQMNAILFIRKKNSMELTEIGELYLECCRKTVTNWNQTRTLIRGLDDSTVVLTVGIPPLNSESFVFVAERIMKEKYPNLSISIRNVYATESPDMLRRGEIDFAMCAYVDKEDDLEYRDYIERETILLVPKSHRLAAFSYLIPGKETQTVPLDSLRNEPLILMDEKTAFGVLQQKWFREYGFSPVVSETVQHFGQMILRLSEIHDALGMIPRMKQDDYPEQFVPVALENCFLYHSAICWQKERRLTETEEYFIENYLQVRKNSMNERITDWLIQV